MSSKTAAENQLLTSSSLITIPKLTMKVHLLATVRKEELLPATTMVFKTLRTGFPTADVIVDLCGFNPECEHLDVKRACDDVGATSNMACLEGPHFAPEWIKSLLENESEPFWICDTDMVFFDSVEKWDFGDAPMAGRYVPQFFDKFTNCVTRARLHTCLIWMNPKRIKEEAGRYHSRFPSTPFNPKPDLIKPMFHPLLSPAGREVRTSYFYDVCGLLYHAIGGVSFTPEQKNAFGHLNFGTISDLVAPAYPELQLRMRAFAIFENPNLLRGQWKEDDEFYYKNRA